MNSVSDSPKTKFFDHKLLMFIMMMDKTNIKKIKIIISSMLN